MRQQSKRQVQVRDAVIGGPRPLICLSLVAQDQAALHEEAEDLVVLQPDLFEWRADSFAGIDSRACLEVLQVIRTVIRNIPLIFTCRITSEGGMQPLPQATRLEIIQAAMASGAVDIVDIELCNEPEFLDTVRQGALVAGCKLILSYHNFQETPDESFLVRKLVEGRDRGADISKLAVMPRDYSDVLTLLGATNKARNGLVDIPLVTMAMGAVGRVTRLAGGLFGSDITFAIGRQDSAPGQIPIADLRAGMALLYGSEQA